MTMDFGNGQNALNDALSAAEASAGQLAGLYGITTAQAYAKLGLTPIAGRNDDNENFTQANASTLKSFAATNGVAELSPGTPLGYAYTKIFTKFSGGTTSTPPPAAGGQITGYGGKCVDDAAASDGSRRVPAAGTRQSTLAAVDGRRTVVARRVPGGNSLPCGVGGGG
ncbi:MAG TPA: hypothetical protein VFX16_04935 [Pseudonocardiaceae bacterium]|nr:hypothetical protein [Pseudonocardiaceae bacterium]